MSPPRNRSAVYAGGYALVKDQKKDVLTAARERVKFIYDNYQSVRVSFSGGKDSTTVLYLCLEEARRRKRLPLEVVVFDEECIDPDTIAYMERLRANSKEFQFYWFCVPIRHTLRAKGRDHWFTWDPACQPLWVRSMPKGAITTRQFPAYNEGLSIAEALQRYFRQPDRWACVGGIRMEESFNRRRAVAGSGGLVSPRKSYDWIKPIYDWSWSDVWRYIQENHIDHSAYYDKMWMEGVSPKDQRVAPWGNVAAARFVNHYPMFYPEFWERAIKRLPELKAQATYGNTKLFRDVQNKPAGLTWQEFTYKVLESLDEDSKAFWVGQIQHTLKRWRRISSLPFPEEPLMLDGQKIEQSWKRLCFTIGKNDLIRDGNGNLASRDRL